MVNGYVNRPKASHQQNGAYALTALPSFKQTPFSFGTIENHAACIRVVGLEMSLPVRFAQRCTAVACLCTV